MKVKVSDCLRRIVNGTPERIRNYFIDSIQRLATHTALIRMVISGLSVAPDCTNNQKQGEKLGNRKVATPAFERAFYLRFKLFSRLFSIKRLTIALLVAPALTSCTIKYHVVYPEDKFPYNFEALGMISDTYRAMSVLLPFTLQGIDDEIPVFDDLNEAYAFTSALSGEYRPEDSKLIFWNTGADIGGGGCGANEAAPYAYIGLPHEWTSIGVAKHIMHEIGHMLGLGHSEFLSSVMGPEINFMDFLDYATDEWDIVIGRALEWSLRFSQ